MLLSPSFALIESEGPEALSDYAQLNKEPINLSACELSGSTSPDLANLIDNDLSTRWHSSGPGQTGNEWIQLRCPAPFQLAALEIQAGVWQSDFARGLRIEVGRCSEAGDTHVPVYENSDWQGSTLLTDSGYPYYSSQGTVRLRLGSIEDPEGPDGNCVRIAQTGSHPLYDWSIADLKLYTSTDKSTPRNK